ncbi:tetratricopeptide repeat protein [Micromonospora sp. WMMA1947]|uniref:ATP-binding protein n=1 Tax=Micromonospora sp. WMMA1947 TaxID=3015163 RepID=UPI00248AF27F|nr:tetratricopeptide repeat protein [Micromonospora sp. WMMA1947]WBC06990.1 tetratricopeptide repeat protein [Micromonospora sp. WMMA1947]
MAESTDPPKVVAPLEGHSSRDGDSQVVFNSVSGDVGGNVVQAGAVHIHNPDKPATPVPRQLPADPAHFTGRDSELAELDALLEIASIGSKPAVLVSAVAGSAGIGKTALALRWAHRVRARFPDGQLYLNLRGYHSRSPMTPPEALGQLLRALGVAPKQVPLDIDEQASLYRSITAEKTVLIILDNVARTEQVAELLPGSPQSFVLVTSRSLLSGIQALQGVHRIRLGLLSTEESIELLRKTIGPQWVSAEPTAAQELTQLCGKLPLALRIAAQRFTASPYDSLMEAVSEIREHRLEALSSTDDDRACVRSVLSWSYSALPDSSKAAFVVLGQHPGPGFDLLAAAALLNVSLTHARSQISALVDLHLLEQPHLRRYRFHDLVRLYASELSKETLGPEREESIKRLVGYYLYVSADGDRILNEHRRRPEIDDLAPPSEVPDFTNAQDVLNWFELERVNLMAITRMSAESGLDDLAWRTPLLAFTFFRLRSHWSDYVECLTAGLTAARQCSNEFAEGWIESNLGIAAKELGEYDVALTHFTRALELRQRLGDPYGEGQTLHHLAAVYEKVGRLAESEQALIASLDLHRRTENRYCEATTMHCLGEFYLRQGRHREAILNARNSLYLHQEIDYPFGQGHAWHLIAAVHETLDEFNIAADSYEQALECRRKIGHIVGQAETLERLGHVYTADGKTAAGIVAWEESLSLYEQLGDIRSPELRQLLGRHQSQSAAG